MLLGAPALARRFLRYLRAGRPAGEALTRAKRALWWQLLLNPWATIDTWRFEIHRGGR